MTIEGKRDALYPGYVLPSAGAVFQALHAEAMLRITPENVETVMEAVRRVVGYAWQAAPEAPAGYKLVPIEPTPEMQQAGHDTPGAHMYNASYRAMVAAAPAPATQQAGAADIYAKVIDALDKHLPYPTEACTIVRAVERGLAIPAATTASASDAT